MQKYKINLNNTIIIIFKLLYKTIIKLIKNKTIIQEININSNQIAQQVANINISKLINIISKKQDFVKKKIILKIVFASLVSLAIAIENTKINKILNILIQAFENLKINNACKIIESKIY